MPITTDDLAKRLSDSVIGYIDACFAERDASQALQNAKAKQLPGHDALAIARQDQERDASEKYRKAGLRKQEAANSLTSAVATVLEGRSTG